MFSLQGSPAKLCDGISRREVLRIGGLSTLGLSLPRLLAARRQRRWECFRPIRHLAGRRA